MKNYHFYTTLVIILILLYSTIYINSEIIPTGFTDSVWFSGQTTTLTHTTEFQCTHCAHCWTIEYKPLDITQQTQIPTQVMISAHNLLSKPNVSFTWLQGPDYIAKSPPFRLNLTDDSLKSMSIQISVTFPGNYNTTQGYTSTVTIQSSNDCSGSFEPIDEPLEITTQFNVTSPDSMKRKPVSTYFFNTYIPTIDNSSLSPIGLDSHKSHAEFQTSAWFNWELQPLPDIKSDTYPNALELRLYGTSYFVINETYSLDPTTTICWINSLPVLISIDHRTNQTIQIYAQPRFDMHNPQATLIQPIPVSSSELDFFSSRFFFEFTCEDRLKIIYDATNVKNDVLVYVPMIYNYNTKLLQYRNDRYATSLFNLPTFGHERTPREGLARAIYDPVLNVFICKTTIDLNDIRWLDETQDITIIAGIDGVTYTSTTSTESPQSHVLLSILPAPSTYADVNPSMFEDDLSPLLFISEVSKTGVNGPYIQFNVPTIKPYLLDESPNAIIQINAMFNVRQPVFNVKEPSCTIVIDNLRSYDKTLSYSTSQYLNTSSIYSKTHPQSQSQHQQQHDIQFEQQLFNEQQQSTIQQQPQQQPTTQSSSSSISTQGYELVPTTDQLTGISITSNPIDDLHLHFKNPHYISFDYIAVNILPGLSRFAFSDELTNLIQHGDGNFNPFSQSTLFTTQPTSFTTQSTSFTTTNNNKKELHSNGEQYIIQCQYVQDKSLKLQGSYSLLSREFHIGPIHHNFLQKFATFEIICDGIEIVDEYNQRIHQYDYPTETIINKEYPLDKIYTDMKLKKNQHFVTLFDLFDVKSRQTISTMQSFLTSLQQSQQPSHSNPIHTLATQLSTTTTTTTATTSSSSSPLSSFIPQQQIQSQLYLSKIAGFSMLPPQRTYKALILGLIFGGIALIVIICAAFPLYRRYESYYEKKRRDAVKIEEVGMNTIPFEELEDE